MKAPLGILATLLLTTAAHAALLYPGWYIGLADISDDYARLSWNDPPPDCPPESWLVQLKVPPAAGGVPDKWVTLGNYVRSTRNVNIDELFPDTDYQVKVTFTGTESTTLSFRTKRTFLGGLIATVSNDDDLNVAWDAQQDATGYYLEWYVNGLRDSRELAANRTSYAVSDLADQSPVQVRMYARLPGAERTGWATAETSTGLPAPSPFSVRPIIDGPSMRLTWSRVDFLDDGYRIERSPWNNENYGFLYQEPAAGVITYDDLSADSATKYFYRIRAEEDNAAVPPDVSAWIETCGWTTAPPAPANLTSSDVTDSSVTLTWNPLQGIEQYAVQRAEAPFTFWEDIGVTPSNEFTDGLATDFPVFPGNTYRYRVRGQTLDQWAGDTGNSLPLDVTTPSASPAPLEAELVSTSRITLRWINVFGETGYALERRSSPLNSNFGSWAPLASPSADSSVYSDLTVIGSMRYQYRVRSGNAAGNSAWAVSNEVSTSTGMPVNVVATPGSGPGNNDCDDTITLTWDEVAGADGYVVTRSLSDQTQEVEFVVKPGTNTTFVDTGLAPYTVYLYRVRSTSAGPDSADGGWRRERTCPWLSTSVSGSNARLTWTEIPSPFSQYRIERRNVAGGGSWVEIDTVLGSANTTYIDTTTTPDGTYEYRIRGWFAGGGGMFTPYSIADTVTVGPPPVTGFAVTECDANAITLAWDQADSADEIRILRSPAGAGRFAIIATLAGDATSYRDSGRPSETAYDYWIFATNANGENGGPQIGPVSTKFRLDLTKTAPYDADFAWFASGAPGLAAYWLQEDDGSGWTTLAVFNSATLATSRANLCVNSVFRILAVDSSNNPLSESTHETLETFNAIPTLSATVQSYDTIALGWSSIAGSTGYHLERAASLDGPWTVLGDFPNTATGYTDTGLAPNTKYFYRVWARDPCSEIGPFRSNSATTMTVRSAWRRSYWGNDLLVILAAGVYADTADFDGDGCLNIFEFIHDTDPTDPADACAPVITYIVEDATPVLSVIWPVRDPPLDGITYSFELTRDLAQFQDSHSVPGVAHPWGPGLDKFGVEVPVEADINGTEGPIFVRLRLNDL